jgi:uncharacterized membrane protein
MLRIALIALLISRVSFGNQCDQALTACQVLVEDQDQSILMIKQQNKVLEDKLATVEDKVPSLPWYGYVIMGLAAGVVAGVVIK